MVVFPEAEECREAAAHRGGGNVMGSNSVLHFIRRRLLRDFDAAAIEKAIEETERETSAEIRVSISPFFWGSIEPVARRAFHRLGMTATRHRNGVLFFVVPSRRKFIVLGDEGIHQKVGQEFWEQVARAVSERFRAGDQSGGLIHGIQEVGKQLAKHFPSEPGQDKNELPNKIDV